MFKEIIHKPEVDNPSINWRKIDDTVGLNPGEVVLLLYNDFKTISICMDMVRLGCYLGDGFIYSAGMQNPGFKYNPLFWCRIKIDSTS